MIQLDMDIQYFGELHKVKDYVAFITEDSNGDCIFHIITTNGIIVSLENFSFDDCDSHKMGITNEDEIFIESFCDMRNLSLLEVFDNMQDFYITVQRN